MLTAIIYEQVFAPAVGGYELGIVLQIITLRPEHFFFGLNSVAAEKHAAIFYSQGLVRWLRY